MTGGVTRCRWPAIVRAEKAPLEAEAFKAILASVPVECPHGDCSAGGCRAQVREALAGVWSCRREVERRAAFKAVTGRRAR